MPTRFVDASAIRAGGPDCSIAECPSGPDPLGGEGSESGRACSGRGHCQSDGSCKCYTGYFGTRCEMLSAIAV